MTTDWNLVKKLKLLGFEENEARVYLASLELGPSPMWAIYQKSFIKRATCYQIFDKFIERGIGAKTPDTKRTIYSVVSPDNLLVSLEQKKSLFIESLPQFEAILSKSPQKPLVSIYEGFDGIRQVYYQGLKQTEGSERLVYGSPQIWLQHQEENDRYVEERVKRRISLRMLFPDTAENRVLIAKDRAELRETRFLPQEHFNPSLEISIGIDRVNYIAYSEKEPFATVIENSVIAQAEREKFELLWNIAKSYPI